VRFLRAFIPGFLTGVLLFLAGFYFNPFSSESRLSPLSLSKSRLVEYSYSLDPGEMLALTNNGNSRTRTNPERVQELWEPAVEDTEAFVTILHDTVGKPAGIGIKISSWSADSKLLSAQLLKNSDWHLFVPEHGTAFVEQTENQWPYLRNIVIPGLISREWQGTWYGSITSGPNALRTAKVRGGSGHMQDLRSEAVEFFQAGAYSAETGPARTVGRLTLELDNRK
jgi:hypothetical protein